MTALCVVLFAAFLEIVILLIQRHLAGEITWVGREFIWMTPVSYLYHLRYIIAGLVLVAALTPRIPLASLIILPIGFLGLYSVLMLASGIHFAALGMVALGVSVQVTRWARARPRAFGRVAHWGALGMSAATLLSALGTPAWTAWRERAAYTALPPSRDGAPNVLLIILDTVRGASLGLYGYGRGTTPELEHWGGRGVVFERALAPSPWTLPSHGSLFTGHYAHELSTNWQSGLDRQFPTLAEMFAARGYHTAGFTANQAYAGRNTGVHRGFLHFEDTQISNEQTRLSSSMGQLIAHDFTRLPLRRYHRKWGEDINASVLRWLDRRPRGAPFFVFINNFDAHTPNHRREEFLPQVGGMGNDRARALYDAGIARADHYTGALLDSLEGRGILDNTIVLVTSDHGEFLGEHGLTKHGNALYDEVLWVPLLVLGPGVPAGVRIEAPVTLRDVPATLLHLASRGEASSIPGHSLSGNWEIPNGRTDGGSLLLSSVRRGINTPPHQPVTRGDMWSLMEGDWHYILNGDGVEELYDLAHDPGEANDLMGSASASAILVRLRSTITRARRISDSTLATAP